MSTSKPHTPEPPDVPNLGLMTVLAVILVAGGMALWYQLALFLHPPLGKEEAGVSTGEFGDLFGGLNTLIQSLALFAILYSILQQRTELALQRVELSLQREEMRDGRVYRTEPIVVAADLMMQRNHADDYYIEFKIRRLAEAAAKNIKLVAIITTPTTEPSSLLCTPFTHDEPLLAQAGSRRLEYTRPGFGAPPAHPFTVEIKLRYENIAGGHYCCIQTFVLTLDVNDGKMNSIEMPSMAMFSGEEAVMRGTQWDAEKRPTTT